MNETLLERLLCLLDVRIHALALCAVRAGSRLQLPAMDNVVVHCVLRGEGKLRVEDTAPLPFGPGSLVFVPPGSKHEVFAPEDEESPAVNWQDAASPMGDGLMRFATPGAEAPILIACGAIQADCEGVDLFGRFREPVAEDLAGKGEVEHAFRLIGKELHCPGFGTRALVEALMKQSLVVAVRQQMERGDLRLLTLIGGQDPRLTNVLVTMLENPAQDYTLQELARISGMSRSLFAERFAEAFDRPPMDLLRQVRLHRAANLLRTTRLPVQIIAMMVGYASRSYFSRAFRVAYGDDPQSFRQRSRAVVRDRENSTTPEKQVT